MTTEDAHMSDGKWVIESTWSPNHGGWSRDMFLGVDLAKGPDRQAWVIFEGGGGDGAPRIIASGEGEPPQQWPPDLK
jgi:hypothetical protein